MAIRLAVDYIDLRVSVKTQEIVNTVSFSSDSAPSLTTKTLNYNLGVDRQIIAPISGILLDFISLDLGLDYQNINVEVLVDSDTKNLYFRPGNPNAIVISVSEEAQILIDKLFADNLSMGDEDAIIDIGLAKSEALSLAEASLISYNKTAATETISFTDNQFIGTSSVKSDELSLSESSSYFFDKANTETLAMLEDDFKVFNKVSSDSLSVSESFARTVIFSRSFADVVSLDDLASVEDPLQTDTALNKDNVAFMSEQHLFDYSTSKSDEITMVEAKAIILGSPKSDTVSLSESNVISLSQIKADSFAISESINILIILGGTSVLNTAALNTSALN
jgi:hypothetical protein